ncbi:MAG: hypothetical protein WAL98_09655 [Desulfatiglandaceae bacterium]|jgi:hypothetical protein
MKIDAAHKALLKGMGLSEEDFERFDGEYVRYEFDEEKGIRLYDPHYATSYNEYIDLDGWSAWSSENDRFMSDFLKKTRKEVKRQKAQRPPQDQEAISEALRKKFPDRVKADSK